MTPAEPRDWLLAVTALTTVTVSPALASETPQAGVVTGALASSRQAQASDRQGVVLGDIVRPGEQFSTGPDGITHILFLDQSSVTLGPNSQMVLDSFSHDSESRSGKIVMSLQEGSLRVVGGINSKTSPTEVRTPSGSVEILGGISVIQSEQQSTKAYFLFGSSMTVNGEGGTETATRPGYSIDVSSGQSPLPPASASPDQLSTVLGNFEASSPATAPTGQGTPPATTTLASSSSPATTLISAADVSGGQADAQSTMAQDRLNNPASALVSDAMSRSRSDTTLPAEAQSPATTVRTPLLPAVVS